MQISVDIDETRVGDPLVVTLGESSSFLIEEPVDFEYFRAMVRIAKQEQSNND